MSNELKCSPGDWQISWNTFNDGGSHGIYDSNSFDIRGAQIAIVSELPGIDPTTDEEMGKANAHLIAACRDLYIALKDLVNGYDTKMGKSAIELRVKIAKDALLKANPDYKH